jgi:hypothetical protein
MVASLVELVSEELSKGRMSLGSMVDTKIHSQRISWEVPSFKDVLSGQSKKLKEMGDAGKESSTEEERTAGRSHEIIERYGQIPISDQSRQEVL